MSLYSEPKVDDLTPANKRLAQPTAMIKTNRKDAKFLAAYISYARIHSRPEISETAGKQLIKEYMAMRSMGNASKTITATPR